MGSSSRPMTPNSQQRKNVRRHLHRSSGVYLLSQSPKIHYPVDPDNLPLESATNTEKFEQLSDGIEELDSNMVDLVLIHEAISSGFNESFASFLYGLSITMWCVDYPGCPTRTSWEKLQQVKGIDERIRDLQESIKDSKEVNEKLREKLALLDTRKRTAKSTQTQEAKRKIGQSKAEHISRPSGEDESYVTNEGSFVINPPALLGRTSRIPQPVKIKVNGPTKSLENNEVTVKSSGKGPNLNQPPRYMRGLFDSSNTTRNADSSKQDKPNGRVARSSIRTVRSTGPASRPAFR
ncbi:uncharacterized protein PRCAT00002578001 [Priceomyces carsonii]|uniref:uncharacterized protein n=1 Tax=Priceomyces carsonii TaxID=28549 RepID=UPI002ED80473|nr:unnamed protein product [Priceomyces carsonii]